MLIGALCFSEDSFPSFMFLRTLFKGGQGERHPHDRLGGSRKKWGQACSWYFDRMGIQLTAMLDQPHNTFLCVIFRLLEHFVSAENSPPINLCTSEIATMALDLLNTSSGLRTPDRNRPTDRIQVIFKEHTANQVFQVQNHIFMVYQVLNLL